MKRDSMIFYRSFYESLNGLDSVIKAEVYDAIFSYGLDFTDPTFTNEIARALFTLIKPQLDANLKRFNNGLKQKTKQVESKTEAKPKQIKSEPEANVNVNVNDNVNNNKKNIEERKKDFYATLSIFVSEYPKEMIREFFNYWSEHGTNDKKMRFEKQTTFGIKQRLNVWYNKNINQYRNNLEPEMDALAKHLFEHNAKFGGKIN
jgi:hypothetical protein